MLSEVYFGDASKNCTKIAMWLDSQIFGDVTAIFSIRNALCMQSLVYA